MLEIRTTDEFAALVRRARRGPAEDVAAALEMVEKLGPVKAAPDSSEWLLWYEHLEAPEFVMVDDWAEFHDSAKEVVARLESPGFAAKLCALPARRGGPPDGRHRRAQEASAARRRGLAMVAAAGGRSRGAGRRSLRDAPARVPSGGGCNGSRGRATARSIRRRCASSRYCVRRHRGLRHRSTASTPARGRARRPRRAARSQLLR